MTHEFGRLLGFLAASIEGKLSVESPLSDLERLERIKELNVFISQASLLELTFPESFPVLGYVVNVLLKMATGQERPKLRIDAGLALAKLLRRHPSNEFIQSIMPGTVTACLKFLPSWEKEPIELVEAILECLILLIQRGHERAAREDKLTMLLERTAGLAVSLRHSERLAVIYARKLELLIMKIPEKAHALLLVSGLALMASKGYWSEEGPLEAKKLKLFSHALDVYLKDLSETLEVDNILSVKIDRITGLCRLIPSTIWSDSLLLETERIARDCAKKTKLKLTLPSPIIISINEWGWNGEVSKSVASLLQVIGEFSEKAAFRNFAPTMEKLDDAPQLLIWSQILKGYKNVSSSESDVLIGVSPLELVDILVALIDEYCCRELDIKDACKVVMEENYWYLCWCCAALATIKIDRDKAGSSYLVRPLLSLQSASASPQLREASGEILHEISKLKGLSGVKELIEVQSKFLLGQVTSDLRYPLLYPRAPLVLESILRNSTTLNSQMVLDTLREIEDRMAEYQKFPAYIYDLLKALRAIIKMTVFSGPTNLPINKRDQDKDEPGEECLNRRMTLEEEIATSVVKVATHFVTFEDERLRQSSLNVILEATDVFKGRADVFLPLVHYTWKPLLGRLEDPVLAVVRQALLTIAHQATIAGDFMRDRVQKELLPKVSGIFAREVTTANQNSSARILLELVSCLGTLRVGTLRNLLFGIVALCGQGLCVSDVASMVKILAQLDADQTWFVLAAQMGGLEKVVAKKGNFPTVELRPYRVKHNWSLLQEQAIAICYQELFS